MAKKKQYSSSPSAVARREQVRQQRKERLNEGQQSQAPARKSRKRAPKRSPWLYVVGTLVVVAVVVGIFFLLSRQSSPTTGTSTGTPVDEGTLQQVTNVDPGILSQVGTGSLPNPFKKPNGSPAVLKGPTGKPEVFYYGAEYCPYCAAERWSMVVALSRFGTFHNLHETTSSSSDVYPSTSTFTFYQSSYTSQYIDFVPVEAEDGQQQPLQPLTTEQQQLVNTYDKPPYTQTPGAFPFVDFGNRYMLFGASYDPGLLRSNPSDPSSQPLSHQDIANQLSSGNNLSKGVLGTANYMTAAICSLTGNQPSNVCSDPSIQQIQATISKAGASAGGSSLAAAIGPMTGDVQRRQAVG
jgi:thiol-disulfide isomerase/thioredoxin